MRPKSRRSCRSRQNRNNIDPRFRGGPGCGSKRAADAKRTGKRHPAIAGRWGTLSGTLEFLSIGKGMIGERRGLPDRIHKLGFPADSVG